MAVEWTDAERDVAALAAEDALLRMHGVVSSCDGLAEAEIILDALAPFVAARESRARAAELRAAADALHNPECPGCANEDSISAAAFWLRDRADRIEQP